MNGKSKSLGLKKSVLITVSAVTSVTLLCVSLIGYLVSYNKVKDTLMVEKEQALLANAERMDAWLGEQSVFTSAEANSAGTVNKMYPDHSHDVEFVKTVAPINSELLDCYTTYEDKTIFMAVYDAADLPEGFDPTVRGWYTSAKSQNKTIFSTPYVDASTGGIIFTTASPIRTDGKFVGVFGCDFKLDVLINLASSMKLTEHGYPVLIDSEGNFLVHTNDAYLPTAEGKTTSYKEAAGDYSKVISSLGNDVGMDVYKDYDGTDKYFAFKKLENAGFLS